MLEIKYLPVEKLVLNETNPRKITDVEFEKLKKSVREDPLFFEARPVLIDENFKIFAGNMRYRAAVAEGKTEVPTIQLNGLPEEKKIDYMLKDNRQNGIWDYDILSGIEDRILLNAGFTEIDLDRNNFDLSNYQDEKFNIDHQFGEGGSIIVRIGEYQKEISPEDYGKIKTKIESSGGIDNFINALAD